MKKHSIQIALAALVFASLACQTVMGGSQSAPNFPPNDNGGMEPPTIPPATAESAPDIQIPTVPPISTDEGGNITIGGMPDFPMPDDATGVINMGDELITFQTKLSLDEALKFYRDKLSSLGYTEKEADTFTTDTVFNLTFEDPKNNKLASIQGVDMGGITSVTISISAK